MLEPIIHPFPASEKKPSTSLDGLGTQPCSSSILDLASSGKLLGRKIKSNLHPVGGKGICFGATENLYF